MTHAAKAPVTHGPSISGSVGLGGVNNSTDVTTVQKLLNKATHAGLKEEGDCDLPTIQAIIAFQKTFLKGSDGKIDPHGSTWRHLLKEAAKPVFVQLVQACGYGYYSYSEADRQYGTPDAIQAVRDVARTFRLNLPQVEIGIGDISFEHGGHMAPHDSHRKGLDIDVRPLRTDGKHVPCTYRDALYSRDNTRLLVKSFLAHRNVKLILFNDPEIKGVHKYHGHDNHLHVEMNQ